MVDLGGGLMHSGLKSSLFTLFLLPTNVVPIEPVNITLSRRSIMHNFFVYFKIFQLKMSMNTIYDKYTEIVLVDHC